MDFDTQDRIESLLHRLESAGNMLYILYIAADQDVFSANAFAPAIFVTYEYLTAQTKQLRELCRTAEDGTDRETVPEGNGQDQGTVPE